MAVDEQQQLSTASAHPSFPTFPTTAQPSYLSESMTALYSVSFGVALLALALSVGILAVIARFCAGRQPYLYLVVNLCAADSLVAVATLGMQGFHYLRLSSLTRTGADADAYLRRRYACTRSIFDHLWDVATYENLLTIFLMTADHFIGLKWPHRYATLVSRKNVFIAIAISWLSAACLGTMKLLMIASTYDPRMDDWPTKGTTRYCYQEIVYENAQPFQLNKQLHRTVTYAVHISVVSLVFITLIAVYAFIICSVRKKRFGRVFGDSRKTANNASTLQISRTTTASDRSWRRLVSTTAMLLASFSLFWLPYTLYSYLHGLSLVSDLPKLIGTENTNLLKIGLVSLVCLTGIVDPFIYAIRVPEIKAAVRRALRCGRE